MITTDRVERLLLLCGAALLLCGGWWSTAVMAKEPDESRAASSAHAQRLNVLFLMTDEQHFRALSLVGCPYIETPNMDRIGREGALFTNATCVTPYCSPSRASMITGLYPSKHRILTNVSGRNRKQAPLPQDAFPNTESLLHAIGYATHHRGKWHLGRVGAFDCYEEVGYGASPQTSYRSFLSERLPAASFATHPSPAKYHGRPVEMVPAVAEGFRKFHALPNNRLAYISIIGRTLIPPELLPETRITDQVIELIERNANKNFMITASWSPPHDLWVVPEPYYSLVDREKIVLRGTTDTPPWDRGPSWKLGQIMGPEGIREYAAIYYGMVKYIDDQVGRILQTLDALELTDKTLVIFTSDHGDMVGAHGCIGKSIRGFYDDLVRIPLLMRLPGKIKPGTVINQPVSQVDLMPTILDFTGQPVPQSIHGHSLRPLLDGKDVAWRDYAYCQRAEGAYMIRTERFKYCHAVNNRMEALYDLHNDPYEDHNLADDPAHAQTVQLMRQRLLEVMKAAGRK